MNGVDVPTVQQLTGYSGIETTMIHSSDHMADAVDKLEYDEKKSEANQFMSPTQMQIADSAMWSLTASDATLKAHPRAEFDIQMTYPKAAVRDLFLNLLFACF
jgi:hypothetical protein